jgi:hypothetical protein
MPSAEWPRREPPTAMNFPSFADHAQSCQKPVTVWLFHTVPLSECEMKLLLFASVVTRRLSVGENVKPRKLPENTFVVADHVIPSAELATLFPSSAKNLLNVPPAPYNAPPATAANRARTRSPSYAVRTR